MNPKEIKVETPLTSYMYHKASGERIPISGTFELSPLCNFNCRMCYVRKNPDEVERHDRPLMTMDRWLEIAEEARESGMLYLLLTGGEPLLWPDFWILYEKLIRMGFLISINTNGSLIDEDAIERFKTLPPTRINITLYGASDETYEALCRVKGVFSRVDQAIQGLQNAGILVKLNGSLTPQNAHDLERCVQYARERKLIYETNTYMFPPLRRDMQMVGRNERFSPQESAFYNVKSYRLQYGEEAYQNFVRNIERGFTPPPGLDESCMDPKDGKIRCRAGKASFWITWDGWMTPCGMMPEPKVDIRENNFFDAWRKLVSISEALTLSGICAQCENRKICHSCAAMALAETGSADGIPRYLCEKMEAMKKIAEKEARKVKK